MRLSVKILGGEECDVSVDPQDSVEFLKREIEAKLKLDKQTEQKLLFKGKALQGKKKSVVNPGCLAISNRQMFAFQTGPRLATTS